jgi:outer membrane immunogenic protein
MYSLTKRVSLAAASAVVLWLSALPAFAADLDLPPPPPPLPELRASVTDWSGLYIGGQLGVSCFEASYTNEDLFTTDPFNVGGCAGMGGVYGGYNYQIGSSFVVGIESDYNAAFDGHLWFQPGPPADVNTYVDDLITVRGRLGWLASDNTMIFATGGVGWLGTEVDALVGGAAEFASRSETLVGFVVGGGLEHAWTENFHIKAEYLYGNFDGKEYTLDACSCAVSGSDVEMHTFRVGASYNFNFGGGYTAVATKW